MNAATMAAEVLEAGDGFPARPGATEPGKRHLLPSSPALLAAWNPSVPHQPKTSPTGLQQQFQLLEARGRFQGFREGREVARRSLDSLERVLRKRSRDIQCAGSKIGNVPVWGVNGDCGGRTRLCRQALHPGAGSGWRE